MFCSKFKLSLAVCSDLNVTTRGSFWEYNLVEKITKSTIVK